jgi:hypothetical protein
MKSNYSIIAIVLIVFYSALLATAQTTNVIPENIFLTDDGQVFWYKPGIRLMDVRKIKQAQESPESRPAEQDPEGHWGLATNGFQLSLRFAKSTFTNGEPALATVLIRNITTTNQTYYRPIEVLVTRDGNLLKRKDDNGIIEINMPPDKTLFPQTQNRYVQNLCNLYDLSEPGEYLVQAVSGHPPATSKTVSIFVVASPK